MGGESARQAKAGGRFVMRMKLGYQVDLKLLETDPESDREAPVPQGQPAGHAEA